MNKRRDFSNPVAIAERNAAMVARSQIEDQRLAETPVVDRNGIKLEVGQLIEYDAMIYHMIRQRAWVTDIRPSFSVAVPHLSARMRQVEYDSVSVEYWSDDGSKVMHGCRASEATVLKLTPGEITHQKLLDMDKQIAGVDLHIVKLNQRKAALERNRVALERDWHLP